MPASSPPKKKPALDGPYRPAYRFDLVRGNRRDLKCRIGYLRARQRRDGVRGRQVIHFPIVGDAIADKYRIGYVSAAGSVLVSGNRALRGLRRSRARAA